MYLPFTLHLTIQRAGGDLSFTFPASQFNHTLANIFVEAVKKPGGLSVQGSETGVILIRHEVKPFTLQVPIHLPSTALPLLQEIFALLNSAIHSYQLTGTPDEVHLRLLPISTPD